MGALGAPPPTGSGERRVLLGRIVDLGEMRATDTLVDAPDDEITDVIGDTLVVLLVDSTLRGFRLSTGQPLWQRVTAAPCRRLLLAGRNVHAGCGDKLLAFTAELGAETVVDPGPGAGDPILIDDGAIVASVHGDGHVVLYGADNHQLVARKRMLELARAFHRHVLAAPAGGGVCVLGLVAGPSGRSAYRAGCYDDTLSPLWTKPLPLKLAPEVPYDVRQLGPRYLVLDDQEAGLQPTLPLGPGRGFILRWRDGQVTFFEDQTFATIEAPDGERLTSTPEVFARTGALGSAAANGAAFSRREAKIVSDRDHSYVVVVNRSAGLAASSAGPVARFSWSPWPSEIRGRSSSSAATR
jgi:hypothetical protein